MITASSSRWQVGRLLDRLHHLGTLRLSAVFDFNNLEVASNRLKEIGIEADNWWRNRDKMSSRDLEDIEHSLSDSANKIQAGLSYRVEKSRYYVKQFEILVDDMRIGRIEGFQDYKQFVKRRLNGDFFFIDSIGVRYERLLDRLRYLNSVVQTKNITHAAFSIERLQAGGEIIAIFGLVPYYAYHVALNICVEMNWVKVDEIVGKVYAVGSDLSPFSKWSLENLQISVYILVIFVWVLEKESQILSKVMKLFRSTVSFPVRKLRGVPNDRRMRSGGSL